METKYTEPFSPTSYPADRYQTNLAFRAAGFHPGAAARLAGSATNQLLRNTLLASDAGPHLDADALEVTMAIHHPDQLREALMRLHQADIAVERVELRTPTLDDVFFELTKAAA